MSCKIVSLGRVAERVKGSVYPQCVYTVLVAISNCFLSYISRVANKTFVGSFALLVFLL